MLMMEQPVALMGTQQGHGHMLNINALPGQIFNVNGHAAQQVQAFTVPGTQMVMSSSPTFQQPMTVHPTTTGFALQPQMVQADLTAASTVSMPMQIALQHPMQLPVQLQAGPFTLQHQSQPPEQRSIFFAGVTPVVSSETLVALFSQFGTVLSINLFKPWSGSRTSKGCGLVVFMDRQGAAAAMEALNGKFVWPGARGAMIVEWMDPNKQHKKARAQPLSYPQPVMQQLVMAPCQGRSTATVLAAPGQLCMNQGSHVYV